MWQFNIGGINGILAIGIGPGIGLGLGNGRNLIHNVGARIIGGGGGGGLLLGGDNDNARLEFQRYHNDGTSALALVSSFIMCLLPPFMLFMLFFMLSTMATHTAAATRETENGGSFSLASLRRSFERMRATFMGTSTRAAPAAETSTHVDAEASLLKLRALPIVTHQPVSSLKTRELRARLREMKMHAPLERSDAVEMLKESLGTDACTCSVCCADYEEGDALRVMRCGHRFHLECLDRWILHEINKKKKEPACPLCAKPI